MKCHFVLQLTCLPYLNHLGFPYLYPRHIVDTELFTQYDVMMYSRESSCIKRLSSAVRLNWSIYVYKKAIFALCSAVNQLWYFCYKLDKLDVQFTHR